MNLSVNKREQTIKTLALRKGVRDARRSVKVLAGDPKVAQGKQSRRW